MRDADAILTIVPDGSAVSPGTNIGLVEGESLGKSMYTAAGMADVPDIIKWIRSLPEDTELCVGGPRTSECPEAYDLTMEMLRSIFRHDV